MTISMLLDKTSTPPSAIKRPHKLQIHNDERVDPFYWMRDRENPEVLAHLKAENAYTQSVLEPTQSLQQELFDEITGRIEPDEHSVPYEENGYFYHTRYSAQKEHPVYYRQRKNTDAPPEILLDVNELAAPHDYYKLGSLQASPDNKILAYTEDTVSRRLYTLRFIDLDANQSFSEQIPNTSGHMAWANDSRTVFYALKDVDSLRSYKIMRHTLGTDPAEDVEVFHEEDDTYHCFVYASRSKAFIIIGSETTLASERRILDANQAYGNFSVFAKRNYTDKVEYDIAHDGDRWLIRTNWDAPNFQLMQCPLDQTAPEHWVTVMPNRNEVLLELVTPFATHVVLTEREAGITQIRVWNKAGEHSYRIDFPEDAHLVYPQHNANYHASFVRIAYQSMKTPQSIYDYHFGKQDLTLQKEKTILGGFNKDHYQSERIYATASDGNCIPISLVYHKEMVGERNRPAPLLLYAYGSYGHSLEPNFSYVRLSLLDRGFIFAIAHIRGGEEMGRNWYESGKLLQKKNTFTDFIACAQHLIDSGYTEPEQLFAMGGSAGGMLMGAVANLRPDLFKGMIAAVPFVDVVTTMLDDTIPLTTFEYDEWGNPNDPVFYDYMKSYSPYDNVSRLEYPAILVTTGLHDSQVQYWEPAKWVAKLRDQAIGESLILLHTDMSTGHGGKSGRYEQHKETAMEYAFLLALQEDI